MAVSLKAGRMQKDPAHKREFRVETIKEKSGTRTVKRSHKKKHKNPRCKKRELFYKRFILGREVGNSNRKLR